jgi:cellulose synthase/poly-beta-1,6-N-acetylglucosamine synthase-like glycosyltransferase
MNWLPAILIFPYFSILLNIYRSLHKIKPFYVSADPRTFISVVVACRNEEEHLPALLKSISEQDYPDNLFEVIIVDDNSTDSTAGEFNRSNLKCSSILIKNKGVGKKEAIRTGVNMASGKLIITTDADCQAEKSWLKTIAAFYEKHQPDMIICPVSIEHSPGFFGTFQELEFLSLQGITAGTASAGNATMCNGANLAFTKEAYLRNAGNLNFEIPSGDDIFFLHSLKKQRLSKILWLESTSAIVRTKPSPTVGSYLRQRKRWISKSIKYSDRFSILLGIVTFVTILLSVCLIIAAMINQAFLPVLFTVIIIKSVPDFLILLNTTSRYARKQLMNWFIPVQLIYPIYVLAVVFYSLIRKEKREISYPFQKGT